MRLKDEGTTVSIVSLYKLIRKEERTGMVSDIPRAVKTAVIGWKQLLFIDEAMADNDELTAHCLLRMMQEKWPGFNASISTVKRARRYLGWVATRPQYCQLICEAN